MCDKERERNCIFRAKSDIWNYCPPRRGDNWKGRPCPVTAYLCGFHYSCDPSGCPVRQATPMNLCQGCRPNIREQAVRFLTRLSMSHGQSGLHVVVVVMSPARC